MRNNFNFQTKTSSNAKQAAFETVQEKLNTNETKERKYITKSMDEADINKHTQNVSFVIVAQGKSVIICE